MNNLWFNIRIGCKHFQLGPDGFRISYNGYHEGYPKGRFQVYTIFGIEL